MGNKILLTLDDALMEQLDAEKEHRGSSRNGTVVCILERYFREEREKRQIEDEWFVAEVRRGLESLKNDPPRDHEDVMADVDEILRRKKNEICA